MRALFLVLALLGGVLTNRYGMYKVGVGIADVTGPAAEIGMMGYANPSQKAVGIHTRLFSRAFIFQSGNEPPVVFVSADIGMVDQAVKLKVVEILEEKYGELFKPQSVLLSGTHTHSGPGAYLQYLLHGLTTLGFLESSFNSIVDGIVESIDRAYENLQPGKVFISKGEVHDANINRSPSSYLANPLWERKQYQYDVDKDMTLLRIESVDGTPLGSVNWFAVHPTSMNNTNRHISGDNKGYASMLFEYEMNPDDRPGKGKFVAAFASSNLGDVSPNTRGARCIDTGLPCDFETSTCGGRTQNCIAFGPGRNMEESTEIIGRKQFDVAYKLFQDEDQKAEQLKGDVKFVHQYMDISNYAVSVRDPVTNQTVTKRTCPAALGYSFAAGTTDGPGMFDFTQGATTGNVFWNTVRTLLMPPSKSLKDCQAPKPILLAVGEAKFPYPWMAKIVETQILKVGNLYIVAVPGEFTTMAGRRLRKAVESVVRANDPNGPTPHVVIAGLSNVYTHYIATFEEYQKQRYEAASTLYGPYTLDAYLQQYSLLAEHLFSGHKLGIGPEPPNLLDKQLSFIPPVLLDMAPFLKKFGDVLEEPPAKVKPGETVSVQFASGHPRNNPMRGETFLVVERDTEGKGWEVVATDADWCTKFTWSRPLYVGPKSVIDITWKVPEDVEPGFYRIRHFGYAKVALNPMPKAYEGTTKVFKVSPAKVDNLFHPEWDNKNKPSPSILSPGGLWNALKNFLGKRK